MRLCYVPLCCSRQSVEERNIPDALCHKHKVSAPAAYKQHHFMPSLHTSIIKHCLSQSDLHREPLARVRNVTVVIFSSLQLAGVYWWIFLSLPGHNAVLQILKRQLDNVYFVLQKNNIMMFRGYSHSLSASDPANKMIHLLQIIYLSLFMVKTLMKVLISSWHLSSKTAINLLIFNKEQDRAHDLLPHSEIIQHSGLNRCVPDFWL